MAYNTKQLLTENGNGVRSLPQHFNDEIDNYEVAKGRNGAKFVEIVGTDGKPLNKLPVDVTFPTKQSVSDADLQAKIDALNTKIDNITNGTTPASTQLTGSNVEFLSLEKDRVVVAGGAIDPVTPGDTMKGVTEITVYIDSDQEFTAKLYPFDPITTNIGDIPMTLFSGEPATRTNRPATTTVNIPVTKKIQIYFVNNGTADATASISIGGRLIGGTHNDTPTS